ncbi:MAG: hypothetical protein M0Z70_00225 [Nitrospiraceae bacterium]|nr:hypothetical protein [Nitrospiraceae bacterium]
MLNWLIIIAIILIFMALKLAKFMGIAIILALVVMLVLKNSFSLKSSRGYKSSIKGGDKGRQIKNKQT